MHYTYRRLKVPKTSKNSRDHRFRVLSRLSYCAAQVWFPPREQASNGTGTDLNLRREGATFGGEAVSDQAPISISYEVCNRCVVAFSKLVAPTLQAIKSGIRFADYSTREWSNLSDSPMPQIRRKHPIVRALFLAASLPLLVAFVSLFISGIVLWKQVRSV
jgi:hypothetical protein